MRREQWIGGLLFLGLIALVALGQWRIGVRRRSTPVAVLHRPRAVMGTTCSMAVVVFERDRAKAEEALQAAEIVLRRIEARMSSWLDDSEISALNTARPGVHVPLEAETLEVLRAASEAAARTGGTFDVTCGPLVRLWQQAGLEGVLPRQAALDRARAASNWSLFDLDAAGATRHSQDACVDLGGITKGYAIDRAVEVLQAAAFSGGLVDVGGDLRCFGRDMTGKPWPVDLQNPFGRGRVARLEVSDTAVTTSGNYARYAEIDGRRYSHIIDPRTGRPAEAAASVTILAPEAMTADIWATALGVLGLDGFALLPEGVEALIVIGDEHNYRVYCTPGCRGLLVEPLPRQLSVWDSAGP